MEWVDQLCELLHWNRIRGKPGLNVASGFVNRTDSTIAVNGSGVFSITPASTVYVIYSGGKKITKNAAETVSITNDQTLHYVYFSTAGVLTVSTSSWDISGDAVPVATVFKDSTAYALHDERHGYRRNRAWHEWAHDTIGARYESGFGGTFADTTFSVAQGAIHDEDLEFDSGGAKTACRLWYRNSGLTSMRFEPNITTPWKSNAGAPQYDNAGTMTNVSANRYFCSYFYATNDPDYPIYLVSGQAQYTTLASARNEANPTILLSTAEWKILYKVIYQENGGTGDYIETIDFRNVSSGPAGTYTPTDHSSLTNRDAAGSHPATAISNTPAGDVAATTVQAAIDELDTEKIAKALLTTAGDIIYRTTVPARLAIGSEGQALKVVSGAPAWATSREVLSAARTYYVRTDGNDSNTGLADTAGGAFLTIQKAVDTAAALDAATYDISILVRSGTYTGAVTLKNVLGAGTFSIEGDTSTPSNVVISTTSANCFSASGITSVWTIKGFKLTTTTSGNCINVGTARALFNSIEFGASAGRHIVSTAYGYAQANGNYSISGNASEHMYATGNAAQITVANRTVTLTGTPAFSNCFCLSYYGAQVLANGNTYSGSATGTRFLQYYDSLIVTSGGGATYFPGDAAGTTDAATFCIYT